ncbi:glycosyltransferase family 2 protein [Novosphingobium sp.]|uniref:glycosyltransferase family 2 protein n=1 Tax=Novosphingobium sp. TaxID=1874826 RepID=UPI003B524E07
MASYDVLNKIVLRIKNRLENYINNIYVKISMVHIYGPKMSYLKHDQVALIILGRDVSYFLDYHINYHIKLGVSNIVYIDNGSSDNSIEIAKSFRNITIAKCSANFRNHQSRIRYLANTRYLTGGWRLAIDPDELLDYPGVDRIDLPELTRRLGARGHTAMVAQMLEMVSGELVSETDGIAFAEVERKFDRFSLSAITKLPYHNSESEISWFLDQNKISNCDIHILFGGLRHAAFGENCCLTKHALFRMGKGVRPQAHPHVTTGVVCTDFSAVLRHYKFAGGMLARERKLLNEGRVDHAETKMRVDAMEDKGDINLGKYAECKDPTVEFLLRRGFLKASAEAILMLS